MVDLPRSTPEFVRYTEIYRSAQLRKLCATATTNRSAQTYSGTAGPTLCEVGSPAQSWEMQSRAACPGHADRRASANVAITGDMGHPARPECNAVAEPVRWLSSGEVGWPARPSAIEHQSVPTECWESVRSGGRLGALPRCPRAGSPVGVESGVATAMRAPTTHIVSPLTRSGLLALSAYPQSLRFQRSIRLFRRSAEEVEPTLLG